PLKQTTQPPERTRQKGEIADRELARNRAPGDVGVGQVISDRADRREDSAPSGTAYRQPAIGGVEAVREASVALDQKAVEPENLDFFGRLHARRRLPQIVEFAPLRRSNMGERIA